MPGLYILGDDGIPIQETDYQKWSLWIKTADLTVARTRIDNCEVSTMFLGVNHGMTNGPPMLYETLVYGGPLHKETSHYSTKREALEGHERICAKVRVAM